MNPESERKRDMTTFEKDRKRIEEALKTGERTRLEIELNPEMVEWLLVMNSERNRKPTPGRVADLAQKIRAYGFLNIEDFKMYDRELINGQHRLLALRRLYGNNNIIPPYPTTGIVVGISHREARLTDTGHSRSTQQRVFMATGKMYSNAYQGAVRFEYEYENGRQPYMLDDQIVELLQDPKWVMFARVMPPQYNLPNTVCQTRFNAPMYVAVKQFWERADDATWEAFLSELKGEQTSRPIALFKDLAVRGFAAVRGNTQTSRKVLYRLSVNLLKAYLNHNNGVRMKEQDWNDHFGEVTA